MDHDGPSIQEPRKTRVLLAGGHHVDVALTGTEITRALQQSTQVGAAILELSMDVLNTRTVRIIIPHIVGWHAVLED